MNDTRSAKRSDAPPKGEPGPKKVPPILAKLDDKFARWEIDPYTDEVTRTI